jgi:hypothetical protein
VRQARVSRVHEVEAGGHKAALLEAVAGEHDEAIVGVLGEKREATAANPRLYIIDIQAFVKNDET